MRLSIRKYYVALFQIIHSQIHKDVQIHKVAEEQLSPRGSACAENEAHCNDKERLT